MSQYNGWDCTPDHYCMVVERQPLPTYKYYFVECLHCRYVSKRMTSRRKANIDKKRHNDEVRKFDFGFGKARPALEKGLRALARSGYSRRACIAALQSDWPHEIPEGHSQDCIPGIRGVGPMVLPELIEWAAGQGHEMPSTECPCGDPGQYPCERHDMSGGAPDEVRGPDWEPRTVELAKCAVEECDKTYPKHYWGAVKAHDAGWFTQKDGTAWCPDHNPEWVAGWRARQAQKRRGGGSRLLGEDGTIVLGLD